MEPKQLKIQNHWLGTESAVHEKVSGKDSGLFADGQPDTIVIHYTGGPSAGSAVNTFRNPQ
ncbi:MAG: N-acetylmuramoyl-L-alanine amidase, partial [Candidatus Cyclonatronum sp.]